ncbi:MAG: hypothetical protein ACREMJ_11005 [Gemmatimonadales bacterium]
MNVSTNPPSPEPEDLQFDQVEHAEPPAPLTCAGCGNPITATYFEVNGQVTCPVCRRALEAQLSAGTSAGRFLRAAALGLLAAGAGFGIYFTILKLTGYELSLVSILVGVMVGAAVKRGSQGRGGWRYQVLAVFLTYSAIVSTYVPFVVEGFRERAQAEADSTARADSATRTAAAPTAGEMVVGLAAFVVLIYAVPFLAGLENILGLFIIGIGLYFAWKTAARTALTVTGPYRLGAAPAAPAP